MTSFEYSGGTDKGRVREQNQDRWFADAQQGIYLVADGMGGTSHGELASRAVVEVLPRLVGQRMHKIARLDDPSAADRLQQAVADMSDYLYDEAKQHSRLGSMGSTVVLALVHDGHALIAHLGDSRAYLLRQGRLERLTKDHNVAQILVESGEISADEAVDHPTRSRLTRFVGMEADALPDVRLVKLEPGDQLLLCSDGLYTMVTTGQMEATLMESRTAANARDRLISAANEAGGTDNIAALIVAVLENCGDNGCDSDFPSTIGSKC